MYYINSNVDELFYLRYLFLHLSNSILFENLRFINNIFFFFYYNVYIVKNLFHNNVK